MASSNNRPRKNDIQELENAFHNLSDKSKSRNHNRGANNLQFMPYIIIGVCLLVIGIVIACIFLQGSDSKTIAEDDVITVKLTIGGVDIEGMTRKEAEEAIEEAFAEKYKAKNFSVAIDGLDVSIPHTMSELSLDMDKIMDTVASYKYSEDTQALNLKDYISVNKESIKKTITELLPNFNLTLVPTQYEVIGTPPESYATIDETVSMTLKVTKGIPGKTVDTEKLVDLIIESILTENWKMEYESTVSDPEPLDLTAIQAEHGALPVEAKFEDKTFKVLGGTYGYTFDLQQATEALNHAEFGESIEIPFQWVEPETTAEELANTLFCDELAAYETHAGYNYNRNTNLRLAAEAINGTILYPGDVFSYNDTLGERTPEKGYLPGASYVGGLTVLDYGGGICQVTSTLYYCTILADMEIVERECHGYASSYTPLSTDATVFWGGIDFKFKNNWNYPIRIDAYTDNGSVYVSLYGTDEKDYYVEFENEWLDTYPFEVVYEEMPEDNEKGYKDGDVIIDPYTGYKSRGYRAYYDKETGELIEKVLESTDVYSSRNKVICKIIKDEGEGEGEENPDQGGTGGENPDQGGENPDQGGDGGENPDQGGDGGENPDQGGENPDQGGDGGENPDQGGSTPEPEPNPEPEPDAGEATEPVDEGGSIQLPLIEG